MNSRDNGKRTVCVEHGQSGGKYARVRWRGRLRCLHVRVYEQAHGPIPAGYEVDHLCGNYKCIRLDHLEAVTKAENVRRSRATKLTVRDVAEIRSRYSSHLANRIRSGWKRVAKGWRSALAAEYGVCPDNVKAIIVGRSWVA